MNRTKTISQLKKLFGDKTLMEPDEIKEIPVSERKIYLDPANVMGIVPKTELFREILVNNFDVAPSKVPDLNYEGNQGPSNYNIKKIMKLLELLKAFTDENNIKISTGKDYPVSFETKHWIFILAPVVN